LGSARRRDLFLGILEQVRSRYDFVVWGYVVRGKIIFCGHRCSALFDLRLWLFKSSFNIYSLFPEKRTDRWIVDYDGSCNFKKFRKQRVLKRLFAVQGLAQNVFSYV